jgi:hypothetical protein
VCFHEYCCHYSHYGHLLRALQVLEMSLSTTPADVLLQLAAGLTQLQQVSLCYGEMADAAAAAAGWSALPLRSLVSAVSGPVLVPL